MSHPIIIAYIESCMNGQCPNLAQSKFLTQIDHFCSLQVRFEDADRLLIAGCAHYDDLSAF